MNVSVGIAVLANLCVIAALPRLFFRRGRLNKAWWLTALPFAAAGIALASAVIGLLQPSLGPSVVRESAALVATSASLLLIGYAAGTHRDPISLWHQENDAPARLVTHGPYARIRHPFYAAFLLTLTAALLIVPHWLTLGSLVYGALRLNATAEREERRLISSSFGAEYASYRSRTRRFVPVRRIGEARR